ncbi:MAG: MlaD family protein, partial [Puniceicoccales bacterium]|nr:MlaD family protein [Puniceicoccales bacterium]
MSKPANPSLIGVFVLGGILLLIIGIGLFGAGYFQGKELDLICFFEDSVNGLDVGSPVKFKGVTIGKVSEVLLRTRNQEENDNAVPVIIAIDPKLLASRGIATYLTDKEKRVQSVEKGLRARLQQQSVITGMLYIELDFYPGNPAKYHKKNQDGGLVEVPTVVSNLGTLMRAATRTIEQFSQIQFAAMGEKMNRILTQLETGADAVDFKSINKGVLAVTTSATELLQDENVRLAAGNLNA